MTSSFRNLKIMALGAHPDDIELNCGGTLIKFKERYKAKLYMLVFSKGGLKTKTSIRVAEQHRTFKSLDVSEFNILNYQDGAIRVDSKLISVIERYINEWKPDIIFTHYLNDIHQDHRNIAWATLTASRRGTATILMYPSMFARSTFTPNFYIDITKYYKQKLNLLSLFESQAESDFMSPDAVNVQARESGLKGQSEYAEEFNLYFGRL